SDEFWKMRLVLSDEEVACLEEAARIGDATQVAVMEQLRPGMTEHDLFRIIYSTIAAERGEIPCMVLAGSESMSSPTSGFQRPRPIGRTITSDDVLLMEVGARDGHGYEAQTGKAMVFSKPPPDYADLLEVMLEAYHRIVAELKPGCTAKELRAAGSIITERGYTIVAPLVHGVFNPIDAGPFVGTSHRPDKDVVLEPNMALCVEIHPCTTDIIKGVFMGDSYVITADGARNINHRLEPKVYELG
ncbi:MAG: aminopeptidase P family protein, partial [Acidimicrobiaceae bacterium]|nr:aminopeptidase P family protein [Acidimicrobiaceae bacterium]